MARARYFSTWGPTDGPIRLRDAPPAIGVVVDPDAPPMPDGMAFPFGHIRHWRGPVVTWRLVIGKVELPGLFVCDRRGFVPAEEWEERIAAEEA